MNSKHLLNESQMDELICDISKQIINDGLEDIALVGIKTRGIPIANWIATKIAEFNKKTVEVGILDINLYRDDLSEVGENPVVGTSELPFSVNGKGIILVDDVLYTGRTIRSAMSALIDFGRPKFIKLMVMVDRGWRELPIQADYIAKKVETNANENVKVRLKETDGVNEVVVKEVI